MILKLIFFYIIIVVSITVCNSKKPNFIKNGIPTAIDIHPYVVSIQWQENHICTGNLVSRLHVLTTANCVSLETSHILSNFKVIAGTADRINGLGDEQVKNIAVIIHHHRYRSERFWEYDLAILTLQTPIRVNNFTRPIRVRRNIEDMQSPLTSVGWGDPFINRFGQFSDDFQEIYLRPTVSRDCRGFEDKINGAVACARILRPAYATMGDSGCPIVFNDELVGIISKKIMKKPNYIIYTDVLDYIPWILNIIF